VKVVCGLGNPGPEYAATRHNLGWWVVDRLQSDWRLPSFRRDDPVLVTGGTVGEESVALVKPLTYMNRSGAALEPLGSLAGFVVERDLLVIVDDVALPVGRVRFRPGGSAGGHNGLKSIEAVLGPDYARLRVGVGGAPPEVDMADWVLSPFSPEEEEQVRSLLPDLAKGVETWLLEGVAAAMSRFNR
jgi:peptidyl-tRNA hydrolase, PTH1 family